MKWIKLIIDKLYCKHDYKWVRNIYGDEINTLNGKRSVWRCIKCGKIQYRDELKPEGKLFVQELDRYYYNHHNEQYKDWIDKHEKELENIKEDMINTAKRGECWYHIVILCKEQNNDKWYYEKYFKSLGLKVECKRLNGDTYSDGEYSFSMKWDN